MSLVSLAVAIAVAAVFAVFGFPFRFYQCWFSWSRIGAPAGVLLYMALAGGGGGGIGWLTAYLANVPPSTAPVIDGLFYGAAGALAVRADFRSGPGVSRGPQEIRGAASLLGKGIEWTTGLLDEVTWRRVKYWLDDRTDDQLLVVAFDIVHEIKADSAVPAPAKKVIGKEAVDAMQALHEAADDVKRAEGRSRLAHFCRSQIVSQHITRPV
ncbi:hypothetical protein KRM28CT15_12890 [Krasilnikovia sp. M28-CT-15]